MTTTPASFQSVASGSNPTARSSTKYGELGGFGHRMIASPLGVRAFIVGLPGSGKSAFLQTCPDAYIFNLDLSSTTIPIIPGSPLPEPKALMWPGIAPEGYTLNDDGTPFVLDYGAVAAKVDLLCKMARENRPRPKVVGIDSLSALIGLLKTWMPLNAVKLGIAGENKDSWKQLDGRAAWDILYDIVLSIMTRLHSHGYGVYFIGHVVNAKIPLGEDRFVLKPELTITDGFWKRLYDKFELVLLCEKKEETVSVPDPRFANRTIPSARTRTYLTTGGIELSGLTKTRVVLPAICLDPPSDAWAVYLDAYTKAAHPPAPPAPPQK